MFSSSGTPSNKDQEEKQKFLDKSNKTKSQSETINSDVVLKPKRSDHSSKVNESTTSMRSHGQPGRRGPKMSDGTEFDTGPYGWIFSIVYLFVLWGLSILSAIGLVYMQYSNIDPIYPAYFGDGSFLGSVPKATFDPNPKRFGGAGARNLMEFNMYEHESYLNYLIRYKILLKKYSQEETNRLPKKKLCKHQKLTANESCAFDLHTGFGDCQLSSENLEHGFGFSKGQPCIMLKVNKILGWHPTSSHTVDDSSTTNEARGGDDQKLACDADDLCCDSSPNGGGIKFECRSNDDIKFEYFPKHGIPYCYFPFANQAGYEQPFLMVKLTNITADKEVTVECFPTHPALRTLESGRENEIRFLIKMRKKPVEDL